MRLAFAFALVGLAARAQPSAPPCVGGQVLTRSDLEAAGVVALPDVLRLLDAPRRTTVDGYRWRTHAAGAPFDEASLVVLLDGEPLGSGPFGEADLHLVPVAVAEVEAVAYCPAPRLVAGAWARMGTLDVRTRAAPSTPDTRSARVAFTNGNETGDLRPQRYLDPSLSNVDKIGPDFETAGAWSQDSTGVQVGFRILRTYPTDPAIRGRTVAALGGRFPRERQAVGSLRASFGGRHTARGWGGWERDLWYAETFGRERAVRRLVGGAGASGEVPLAVRSSRFGRATLGYDAGLAASSLDRRDDATAADADPAWREGRAWAALHVRVGEVTDEAGRAFTLGVRADRVEASGPGLDEGRGAFTLGRLTLRAERTPERGLRRRADVALVTTGRDVALQAATTVERALRGGHAVALVLSAAGTLPEETPDYGFWQARGYTGLDRTGVPYDARGGPHAGSRGLALLSWTGPLAGALRAEAAVEGRAYRGLYVERTAFRVAADSIGVEGPVVADPDARGEVLAARASVAGGRGAAAGRAFYSLEADIGGTPSFREAWAAVPRHRAGLQGTLRPGAGLTAWAGLEAISAARWTGYAALDGGGRVPALVLLDAALAKTLWDGRLRASVLLRNVLGREERYHPLGADLAFRLYLRLEARF